MAKQHTALRRLTAGIGAVALALVGVVGASTAASAADQVPGNINPDATGSIIIHKHVEDPRSTDGNPAGDPLNGVTFRVTEVLLDGSSVPLATSEAWSDIDGLLPADIPGAGFTLGTSQDVVTGTVTPGVATAGGLNVGFYLVEEIGSGPNLITSPADPFLVTIPYPGTEGWIYDVDVYPKNVLGTPTPTKTVGTPDTTADIEVGAHVPFDISLSVAQSSLPYVSLSIEDVLTTGLDFVSWTNVAIGGTALDAADYSVSADNSTISLTESGLAKLNAITAEDATSVTATLTAEVTSVGQLKNTATATINGKPGTTPEVKTNWAQLDLMKTNDAEVDPAPLAGATFELYADDETTLLATGTTNSTGELSFIVWVGNDADITETVYLKETVAPPGYVLPSDPWFGPYVLTAGETAEASISTDTITNFMPEGVDLPLTGAQGTAMMTFGGLFIIAAGASLLLIRRRRHPITE